MTKDLEFRLSRKLSMFDPQMTKAERYLHINLLKESGLFNEIIEVCEEKVSSLGFQGTSQKKNAIKEARREISSLKVA